jgi:hypothetical protein
MRTWKKAVGQVVLASASSFAIGWIIASGVNDTSHLFASALLAFTWTVFASSVVYEVYEAEEGDDFAKEIVKSTQHAWREELKSHMQTVNDTGVERRKALRILAAVSPEPKWREQVEKATGWSFDELDEWGWESDLPKENE